MVQLRAQRNITVHESSILFVACCFVACCLLLVIYCLLLVIYCLLPVACCLSPSFRKQLLYVRLINSMGLAYIDGTIHTCGTCMYVLPYHRTSVSSLCIILSCTSITTPVNFFIHLRLPVLHLLQLSLHMSQIPRVPSLHRWH